jgi:ribosome-binding factor A
MADRSRRGAAQPARQYPRRARVNEILREVVADALERLADRDERLAMLTVTAVDCDPDLRHATVLLASLDEADATVLAEQRVRLQTTISHEVRLRRTPQLSFAADPAVSAAQRIEDILAGLHRQEGSSAGSAGGGAAEPPGGRADPEPGGPSGP